jgi:uncharacterized membrane protein YfcA
MTMELGPIILAVAGIALGGFLKGATGAGAPVVGVPVLALIFGVPKAVAVFSVLNLVSNLWQGYAYRQHRGNKRFVWGLAIAGGLGAVVGSVLLANLPTEVLMGGLAVIVFLYIVLRLARPDWSLARERGETMAPAVGFLGGVMQGAGGISAPVSVTYLNAMRLDRNEFIATITVFFTAMSALQVPALIALGVLTWQTTGFALVAAVPLFAAMPVGAWAARRLSKDAFDRMILILLAVIAVRLGWKAVF